MTQQKKQAIILRHAQARSPASAPTDAERPLTASGQLQSVKLGRQLIQAGWIPDFVVVSPAKRTLETFKGVMQGLGLTDLKHSICPSFYLGGHHAMMIAMAQIEVEYDRLLLIGHNPGWSEAISFLTGQYFNMETGHALEVLPIEAQLDWMTVFASAGSCQLGRTWR